MDINIRIDGKFEEILSAQNRLDELRVHAEFLNNEVESQRMKLETLTAELRVLFLEQRNIWREKDSDRYSLERELKRLREGKATRFSEYIFDEGEEHHSYVTDDNPEPREHEISESDGVLDAEQVGSLIFHMARGDKEKARALNELINIE